MSHHVESETNNPIVDLIESIYDGDVRTTTVRVRADLSRQPDAPASLIHPDTRAKALDLHRVARASGYEIVFETYGSSSAPPSGSYVLQGWWIPDALALVADTSRDWVRAPYPDGDTPDLPDNGPDFCLLTYESFVPGVVAYTDGQGAWVSVAGYEQFIAGDLLRYRAQR